MTNHRQANRTMTIEQAINNYIKPARELARELAAACETSSGEQLKKRDCYLIISSGWGEVINQSGECKDLATLYNILEETVFKVEELVDLVARERMYMVAVSFNPIMKIVMDNI